MTTGERIKAARKRAGLTQKELGQKLGISASMIGQYETNIRTPKHGTILKLAGALKVPPNDLYDVDNWATSNIVFGTDVGHAFAVLKYVLDSDNPEYSTIQHLISDYFPNFDELYNQLPDLTTSILSASLFNPPWKIGNEGRKIICMLAHLNDAGVKIALERIDELTEIPRYQHQHTCICGNKAPSQKLKAEVQPEETQTADGSETPSTEK